MQTLELKINDNIFDTVIEVLKNFSSSEVQITQKETRLKIDDSHIPYVSAKEEKEILEELKDPECHKVGKRKVFELDI